MLGPTSLRRASKRLAALLWSDIAPARCTEADSLSLYWRRQESATRVVEHLQREIE